MEVGYVAAFIGGVLTLVSPCSALLLPAFFAYAFDGPARLLSRTGVFYLGLATTLVPLGIAASAAGALINEHRSVFVTIASTVVILLGVVQLSGRGFGLGRLSRVGGADSHSVVSVYLLGAVYGVAGVCAGPILGSVLAMSAIGSDPVYGSVLLAIYALGMAGPLFVLAALWRRLDPQRRRWLRGSEVAVGRWHVHTSQLISGLMFIGIGILLLFTDGTAGLGGLVSVETEYRAQLWARDLGDRIPDLAALAVVIAVVVAVAVWRIRRGRVSRALTTTDHTTAGDKP
ncbi:cytochrome c biogenesis CcdA family protein [Haloactinopolyspora sp.]|uniref:cytochrome c biogenesis CcdA family protein n=1 Tax=Haloactinopolyspora sp. TaxID=1966353 RepID=UPI002602B163|nr:cytochrome c biogenesis CcdA family protein [Haloactinopolyspora sp.]